MAAIQIADLNNGKVDVDHIGAFANSTALTAMDRLGRTKRTLAGIDAEAISRMNAHDVDALARMNANDLLALLQRQFIESAGNALLAALGYQVPVAYTAGLEMTTPSQTVEHDGNTYAPIQSELPFTTSGVFEVGKFRLIQGVSGADLSAPYGSGMVGFLQLGTSAVPRPMQDKQRDTVSANDFGAIGDGTSHPLSERFATLVEAQAFYPHAVALTDEIDWAAIVAAMTHEAGVLGGEVSLERSYVFNRKIVVPSGVSLKGKGKKHLDSGRAYTLIYTGTDCAIEFANFLDSSFQHRTRIEDISLKYDGSPVALVSGIRQNLSSTLMRNVRVFDFTQHGFDLGTCIFSTFENLYAIGCGEDGIRCASPDIVYPGGQCVFINPIAMRCKIGMRVDNYQTTRVIGGTIALNTQQQLIVAGSFGVGFSGVFFEPKLGDERTYVDKLVQVVGGSLTNLSSVDVSFIGCNFYAGQAGTTPRYNYGVHVGNARNVKVEHCDLTQFAAAGIKVVFDTNTVTGLEVGPNRNFGNLLDLDESGASDSSIRQVGDTQTLHNHALVLEGTSTLTLPGTFSAPILLTNGAYRVWADSTTGEILRKSGAPASGTDGTSVGLGASQATVGAAGLAATLPAKPTGYISVRIGGTEYVVPYYAKA